MKSISFKNGSLTWISLLLALPTAYFLTISVLKYEAGIDGPFDTMAPFLDRMGINKALSRNVNLLISFGPVIAFAFFIFQVVRIKLQFTENHFLFQFILKKRWLPFLVAAFSVSLLGILFIYLVRKNCTG